MFPNSRGVFFFQENKNLRQAHRPWGGWSAHAIVTSYRYTDTLQVYRHPTSIQYPEYKSRHPNTSPDTQNTSPDTQNISPDLQNVSSDTQNISPDTQNTSPESQNESPDTQNTSPDIQNTDPDTQRTYKIKSNHIKSCQIM